MEKKNYENLLLQMNRGRISKILFELDEHRFKSHEPGSFNVYDTTLMFKGLINEIERLDKENRELKERVKSLEVTDTKDENTSKSS